MAAIRNTQLSLSLPDSRVQSAFPVLRRVLAGINRSRLNRGKQSKVRLPITGSLLHDIRKELERSDNQEKRVLWAVCCMAFFGFLHLGELLLVKAGDFNPRLHLAWGDMAVDDQQSQRILRFHIKQYKMDPFG